MYGAITTVLSKSLRAVSFFVINTSKNLATPDSNLLQVVTRYTIFETSQKTGFVVEFGGLQLHVIPAAREAIVSSTTKRMIPVSRIDDAKSFSRKGLTGNSQ